MSIITNKNVESIKTGATLEMLEKVLISDKFKVTRTQFGISATKKGFWTSRAYYITFTDSGEFRFGECDEVGQGLLVSPKGGTLARIVSMAEEDKQ